LNYAYLSLITPFIGRKFLKKYYDYPRITSIGKNLLEEVPEEDQGRKGDIQLINAWAETLGLDGWFVLHKVN